MDIWLSWFKGLILMGPLCYPGAVRSSEVYLLALPTDAVWTGLNCRGVDTLLRAVDKEHAELKGWLSGPPVAFIVLAAKLVTSLRVFSHFEVKGIFLK